MTLTLLEGRELPSPLLTKYEMTVLHRSWFGLVRRVQIYRGRDMSWRLYPQGWHPPHDVCCWLEAQAQQYKWSKETPR